MAGDDDEADDAERTLHAFVRSRPRAVPDNFIQQPFGFPTQRQDVGPDFFQCPQRLELIEVADEADLLAGLGAGWVVPGSRCLVQHYAVKEALDAAAQPFDMEDLSSG